ncbi:zinc-dependent alcohol dehydrogenase family protein [Azospirillum halopraeferens]|uniref:zinc-dependent alcohol dehydrogenase family protein n=1 Tax=Azospirillum halopraeferens TaxID=34010 RepID=UPI00040F0094|nr:zinc-dependent alcohol dehydrogenase family protein [Azospirillum halopraeferens]
MRALICRRFGDPAEVVRPGDAPEPACGPGELLVRVTARAVNPSDLLTVSGTYAAATPLPFVPGFEGVGTVVAAGAGVDGALLGRRVLALRGGGTWQERVAVPAQWAVAVPDAIPDAAAAQLYINPLSVRRMLTEELRLPPGAVVVVNAAGSACGRLAAQTCREAGLRMLALCRSGAHTQDLLALGAAAVVDTSREDPAAALARLTGGGAAAALDAVGGAPGAALVDLLAPGAVLLAYGLLSGSLLSPGPAAARARGVTVRRFWLKPWVDGCTPAQWRAAFAAVIDRVADGRLVLPAALPFDLADAAAAMRAAAAPGRRGKVVLVG